jgi:hypothetical protein
MPKLFGKDPAFWVGIVQAALLLVLGFSSIATPLHLTDEVIGLIVAFTSAGFGVYTAWVTRDTMLGYLVGFAKALIALLAAYNLELSVDQITGLLGIITIGAGLLHRDRTSPLVTPAFDNPPDAPVLTDPVPLPLPLAA